MEAVEQEGEVGRGFWCKAVVLEAHVLGQGLGRFPSEAERGVGDHGVELGLPSRVGLAEHLPVVGQRVAVEDFELGILYAVQQHVHAS